jgi:hypothetical protein
MVYETGVELNIKFRSEIGAIINGWYEYTKTHLVISKDNSSKPFSKPVHPQPNG